MALDHTKVLVKGKVNFYQATVGTIPPEDLTTIVDGTNADWVNIGHTADDNPITMYLEAGEENTIKTEQASALFTNREANVYGCDVDLHQLDEEGLDMYYGADTAPLTAGSRWLTVSDTPSAKEMAFLAVVRGGNNFVCWAAPRSEVFQREAPDMGDETTPAKLPVRFKFLQHDTNSYTMLVSPIGPVA